MSRLANTAILMRPHLGEPLERPVDRHHGYQVVPHDPPQRPQKYALPLLGGVERRFFYLQAESFSEIDQIEVQRVPPAEPQGVKKGLHPFLDYHVPLDVTVPQHVEQPNQRDVRPVHHYPSRWPPVCPKVLGQYDHVRLRLIQDAEPAPYGPKVLDVHPEPGYPLSPRQQYPP